MPGIIVFKRRWSVGSDDLIIPSSIFFIFHSALFILLLFLFISVEGRDWRYPCMSELYEHCLGYFIILIGCMIIELCICYISSKGTIMNNEPRSSMQYLLYIKFAIFLIELIWLSISFVWLYNNYEICNHNQAKEIIFLIVISNSIIIFFICFIGWCSFDSAGSSWLKMKRYQNNLKENSFKLKYKRSSSTQRNWRHREAIRKYRDSWNRRCRLLFCCLGKSNRHQNSFTEISKLLSDFFRDLDLVPSDVITGLIIIRKYQNLQRKLMINNTNNDIYDYMSGVPIRMNSQFLDLNKPETAEEIQTLIYYLDYAMAAYGWPIFILNKKNACCKLCSYLKFKFHCLKNGTDEDNFLNLKTKPTISGDNCCECNYAALKSSLKSKDYDLVYTSYYVDVGQPSFIVVLDHSKKALIICVRGTLSLKDIITDLNAEGDILPVKPPKEKWLAHNGMIEAATYIQKKLSKNKIIEKALNFNLERNTQSYTIVLVGHSLGAGTVSILAILLKEYYPDLVCYAFSPPGGLLSLDLVEHSKSFITSVVLGEDIVPRLGLHQMENLRFDLINAIKENPDPKWKIIGSTFCCCKASRTEDNENFINNLESTSIGELSSNFVNLSNSLDNSQQNTSCNTSYTRSEKELSTNPQDSSISLTVHQPFYPPGKIIHIVRSHCSNVDKKISKKKDVIYKALYVNNTDFDQILITPVIVHDHMPHKIMEGLQKLLLFSNRSTKNEIYYKKLNMENCSQINYSRDHSVQSLLLNQYNSNWSNDTLDRTYTVAIKSQQKKSLKCLNLNLNQYNYDLINSYKSKSKNSLTQKSSFLDLMKKVKKIDLASDFWFGKAPLATPETLSETSSICSRIYSEPHSNGKRNNLNTVSESIIENNLYPEMSTYTSTSKKDTIIHIENENSVKIDLSLNIDVNALFDEFEKQENTMEEKNLTNSVSKLQEPIKVNSKTIQRTSSLKRTNSTSSSSFKRVTFDSTTLFNTDETFNLNSKKTFRRSNSEKINRNKMFSYYKNLNNVKLNLFKPEQNVQYEQKQLLNLINQKNNDEEDNVKNEKLEKQLEELLGCSFSYSETDLSKIEEKLNDKLGFKNKSNENNDLNILENSIKLNNLNKDTSDEHQNNNSYIKQSSSNMKIRFSKNFNKNFILNENCLPKIDKKNSFDFRNSNLKLRSNNEVPIYYNKKQFQKLFQKLSEIESNEELDVCDTFQNYVNNYKK